MRDKVLKIRLTSDEFASLRMVAVARGLTMSELCRRKMANVPLPRKALDTRDGVLLGRILGALAKVGSNLNQIAKAANAGRQTSNMDALANTLRGINELRGRIWELLS